MPHDSGIFFLSRPIDSFIAYAATTTWYVRGKNVVESQEKMKGIELIVLCTYPMSIRNRQCIDLKLKYPIFLGLYVPPWKREFKNANKFKSIDIRS